MLQPNTYIQRRYRVTQLIGVGGTGAVYQAFDKQRGYVVALKHLLLQHAQAARAFEREARLLSSLCHPALPQVLDYFSAAEGQFLVMEFIPGDDLAALLQRNSQGFPATQVLGWAGQLLDVLTYLHSQQPPVIHRDIKPHNLKLRPGAQDQIVLLDFGLAKGNLAQLTTSATTGSAFGYTLSYAPLEQIQGTGTDPRSDLYALSATLYHLFSGAPPADALTRAAALINGAADPLAAPAAIPQVPLLIGNALRQGLALKIDERPASAMALRQQLQLMPAGAYTGVTVVANTQEARQQRVPVPRRRFVRALLPICAVVALLLGLVMFRPLADLANDAFVSVPEPAIAAAPAIPPVIALNQSLVAQVAPLKSVAVSFPHTQGVAFSADRSLAAAGINESVDDGKVRIWKTGENGVMLYELSGMLSSINCLTFSNDGTLLAVGTRDGRVWLWRVADGQLVYSFKKHFQGVSALVFSPDDHFLATASTDDTIRLWQLTDQTLVSEQEGYYKRESGITHAAQSLVFSPDGQNLLLGFANGAIELRQAHEGQVLKTFLGHSASVYSLAFAPDGRTFASGADDLRVWRLDDGQLLYHQDAHQNGVTSVAFSPDGKVLASGSYDTTVALWSAADGTPLYRLAYDDLVRAVAFAPDGRTLMAAGGEQTIALWRLE